VIAATLSMVAAPPDKSPSPEAKAAINQTGRPSPTLTIKDDKGRELDLLSLEAYRAEFQYLRRKFRELDLTGAPVRTDGWKDNIPEAEWPFMGFSYFGYACANLARSDQALCDEALAETRWLLEALQTPRLTGFIADHFGEPFTTNRTATSAFVHGHFLNLTLRYREVSGDQRYDGLIQRVAQALFEAYTKSDQAILKSYTNMWWVTDNCPALSALARYDRQFNRDTSSGRRRFVESLKAHYLDSQTGMLCTYVDPAPRRSLQGPRGVSQMYGLHFLKDIDPEFAAGQYALARRHLFRPVLGLLAVREFPEGVPETADVDSGPVVLGLGPSASGFGIAAAAINGDTQSAWQLAKAATIVGAPEFNDGELRYALMPAVGQAVILFGKTLLTRSAAP